MNIIVTDVITSLRFIAVLKQHIMNVPFISGGSKHEWRDSKHGCGGFLREGQQHWGNTLAVICVTFKQDQRSIWKSTL